MGSRLLNGSPQLSVRVTLFPVILIVLSSTVTSGTITGTPVTNNLSLSTVVLNSRDRQGMYGMQHFLAPINKPHNSL